LEIITVEEEKEMIRLINHFLREMDMDNLILIRKIVARIPEIRKVMEIFDENY